MAKKPDRKKRQLKQAARNRRRAAAEQMKTREKVDRRRSIVVDVTAMGGVEFEEPHVAVIIEPVRLPDGKDLYFHAPFIVPFYLLKSKGLRDVAEPKRVDALKRMKREADGTYRPTEPFGVLDALEDLALSVILAAAAIEAHANEMIERLPDDAMVEVPTRIAGETVIVVRNKAGMDRLPIADKLHRCAPLLHRTESIKGTTPWADFKRINRVRNQLVHQRRGAYDDPTKPSPFGRLLLGEFSRAAEEAAAVIEALEPGWIPKEVRAELGLAGAAEV